MSDDQGQNKSPDSKELGLESKIKQMKQLAWLTLLCGLLGFSLPSQEDKLLGTNLLILTAILFYMVSRINIWAANNKSNSNQKLPQEFIFMFLALFSCSAILIVSLINYIIVTNEFRQITYLSLFVPLILLILAWLKRTDYV